MNEATPTDPHPRPSGPEDKTPGCSVHLSSGQMRTLRQMTADHPYGVTLRNRGASYVAVELIGQEGEIVSGMLMTYAGVPPVAESPWKD
jgi:hypothetical protein